MAMFCSFVIKHTNKSCWRKLVMSVIVLFHQRVLVRVLLLFRLILFLGNIFLMGLCVHFWLGLGFPFLSCVL